MSLAILRRSASLRTRGREDEAAALLRDAAIHDSDLRLPVRLGADTADLAPLREAAGRGSGAACYHAALIALRSGDRAEAARWAARGEAGHPAHRSFPPLAHLCRFMDAPSAETFAPLHASLPDATDAVRVETFLAVERELYRRDPADTGPRAIVEQPMAGPFGALLGLLDRLAVELYSTVKVTSILLTAGFAPAVRSHRFHALRAYRLETFARYDEAAREHEAILAADPGDPESLDFMIRYALWRADAAEARRHYDRLEEILGDTVDEQGARRYRGEIAYHSGHWKEAAELLAATADADRFDPLPPYRAAMAHLRLGDEPAARREFARTLWRITENLVPSRFAKVAGEWRGEPPAE